MALVTLKEILGMAKDDTAIGSFSVINIETISGAIQAGTESNVPIILQVAETRLKNKDFQLIGSAMVNAAKNATIPVCVHFDHGLSKERIEEALLLGFTSVMYDGSHLPYEENIENTIEIVELARSYGASCEGELGKLGLTEDESESIGVAFTNPDEAKDFIEKTHIDALAISIGNMHGMHTINTDEIDVERLKEIKKKTDIPLVLHGGSNLTNETFRQCIENGIKKINIASAIMNDVMNTVKSSINDNEKTYFDIVDETTTTTKKCVQAHIDIFCPDESRGGFTDGF